MNREFLEFVHADTSKAAALQRIGEMFGIQREEMIAFGDGMNDLSMLQYAGLGIAMENAPEELKEHADLVTKTNEEDGVAWAIQKIMESDGFDQALR